MKNKNWRIKQFCPKGHDTFIVGRNKNGCCNECAKITQRIDPSKNSAIHQFCPKKHDTFVYGRTNGGICNACVKPVKLGIRLAKKRKRQKQKICRKGHNIALVGRDNGGHCNQCRIENTRFRLANDAQFKLATNLRTRLWNAIKTSQKKGSAVRDLGCTIDFLKNYLESKFYDNMTWNNWGKVWELDHVKALWKFDLTNRKQFLKAINYKNLQPLTIEHHRKKSSQELIYFIRFKN